MGGFCQSGSEQSQYAVENELTASNTLAGVPNADSKSCNERGGSVQRLVQEGARSKDQKPKRPQLKLTLLLNRVETRVEKDESRTDQTLGRSEEESDGGEGGEGSRDGHAGEENTPNEDET